MSKVYFLFLLCVFSLSVTAQWVTIRNGVLSNDTNGKPVQAHAAGFLQVGDTWYKVGEDRSNKWRPDVNLYSSKDLVNWKFERKIIQNGVSHPSLGGDRMIERAKLLYNKPTGKFVVWCHWEAGNYGASEAAVFYCDSVNGPYTFHWAGRPMGIKSRDCNVFVDSDGTGYFISTTEENQHLGLFKLSADYLSVVSHTQLFAWQAREAPAIIKINNLYYMISSACTGWDSNQAKIATSTSLTSGWTAKKDIGNANSFDTQAASILEVKGTEGTTYVYVGDRWMDPDLYESKTIMFPVEFNNGNMTFNYTREWDLDVKKGIWRVTPRNNLVSKTNWKIHSVSSQEVSGENGRASNVFDGNINTMWHTKWQGGVDSHPHDLQIDLGGEYLLTGFIATPRQTKEINGAIRNFLFYCSTDGVNWGSPVAGGWMPWHTEISFQPTKARFVRMVAYSEFSGKSYASLAELDLVQGTTYNVTKTTPYARVGTGSWSNAGSLTMSKGQSLSFGPQPDFLGTWAWHGPNNRVAMGRNVTIENIQYEDEGTYTGLYLDPYNNMSEIKTNVKVSADVASLKSRLKIAIDRAKAVELEGMEGLNVLRVILGNAEKVYNNPAAVMSSVESMITFLTLQVNDYAAANVLKSKDLTDFIASTSGFTSTTPNGWEGTSLSTIGYKSAEFFNKNFDFQQTIDSLENGYYLIGVQGFYRSGVPDGGSGYSKVTETLNAYFIANEKSIPLHSLYSIPYNGDGNLNGYIHSLETAAGVFEANAKNFSNWLIVPVTDGKLKFGLIKNELIASDWTCFSDFKLYKINKEITSFNLIEVDSEMIEGAVFGVEGKYAGYGNPFQMNLKPGIYIINRKKVFIQ